nr:MFS transporter [Prescottella equi]
MRRWSSIRGSWAAAATTLRHSPGLARLTAVRFASQYGDGLFQAALGGAILFNPERETEPLAIAAGFAVLLLPYSVIGPFAGALLDRWDRRAVLLWANALRGLLILVIAAALIAGAGETPLLLLALAAIGVSRFVLAGISASLPHVVRQSWLVPTNSVLATAGSVFSALGAGTAVAVIGLVGEGDVGSGTAVAVGAVGSVIAVTAARGFARHALGPTDTVADTRGTALAILEGLRVGATAVWQAPGVTTAMLGIGAHRIAFGVSTLLFVLILRDPAAGGALPGGLAGFGVAVAATAAGLLFAALVTPWLIPRLGRPRTVTVAIAFALVVQVTMIATLSQVWLLAGAFLLGFAGQTVKLTGDAAMQIEIDDDRRGQVFALQDTVFNVAFCLAIAAAATVVPADGRSLGLVLAAGGVYALSLLGIGLNSRRTPLTG